ncbi:MAG: MupA/Atu3671 family FMN-dependent luciferase-like monooxygenase [Bacteroidota bacterium]
METIEDLLNVQESAAPATKVQAAKDVSFSFLFFSDVRKDVTDAQKYEFMKDVTVFGDKAGFEAVYIPERHFYEFGSIYANSAVMAAYLIPQTERIRFRTAGVSVPLHHPAEVVEWWAMNDILSNGRVDLGFGTGWNRPDFIYAPENYENRKQICWDRIPMIQKLWRGETVTFSGVGGEEVPINVFPRPVQKELNVWLLATKADDSFIHAGKMGYNVFTMLYGIDLKAMGKKIDLYRKAREEAGYDPKTGIVSLMMHTMVHEDVATVEKAVEVPFKEYIKSSLNAHMTAKGGGQNTLDEAEKEKMLSYAYHRYFKTGAVFGSVEDARQVVDEAIEVGVNDIACLVDFGVDYDMVRDSLPYLKELVSHYL